MDRDGVKPTTVSIEEKKNNNRLPVPIPCDLGYHFTCSFNVQTSNTRKTI